MGNKINLVVAVLAAAAIPVSGDNAPFQHRVAYSGSNGMAVSWNSNSKLSDPKVQYGSSPTSLEFSEVGISSTFSNATSWDNHVVLQGLNYSTTYYYSVSNTVNASGVYSFTTAPKAGTNEEFVFAMANDLGLMGALGLSDKAGKGEGGVLSLGERNTIQALQAAKDSFKFLWHVGDLAYADYWLKEESQLYLPNTTIEGGVDVYNKMLNGFYDEMSAISATTPYMVGPGNHDSDCVDGSASAWGNKYKSSICVPGQLNFTGYLNHWNMPSNESGGYPNMWYSFDYGNVHFVQINTETNLGGDIVGPDEKGGIQGANSGPFGPKNGQIEWLKKDLATVNRTVTPWVIVGGHRPWYQNSQDPCLECQQAFEQILIDNEVDIVVHGHKHNYSRFKPVALNVTDPNGLNNPSSPWYIVNGAAGHYDGIDPFVLPLENFTAFGVDTTYGWSRFTVHNCTHITQEFVASNNGSVLDSATLYKAHAGSCGVERSGNSSSNGTGNGNVSGSSGPGTGSHGPGSNSTSNGTTGYPTQPDQSNAASAYEPSVAVVAAIALITFLF